MSGLLDWWSDAGAWYWSAGDADDSSVKSVTSSHIWKASFDPSLSYEEREKRKRQAVERAVFLQDLLVSTLSVSVNLFFCCCVAGLLLCNAVTLKKLIRKGIPPVLRPKVWFSLSGAAKKKSTVPETYYNDLTKAVEGKVTPATLQIDHVSYCLRCYIDCLWHFLDLIVMASLLLHCE
ncbi:hypothetical protein TEA_002355 [Camellia sinensis var. sinensis]|uniref:Di19 C-terminal domain-containing protein n=1 Tax=Camellia sinensis var. sinensis TaxID=542762 RepID=A0A4S4EKG1_CAMSN|nr:hypothetical protein TEA_002355 [Camellia sinensis var. sinensis]